jgi:tRNA1Val (adenine37-N6)-methyltransferase
VTDVQVPINAGESIDRLGYQGLRIIQNPDKFKFTLDAFLLVGFIKPKTRDRIVDLGTGGGVLPLLLAGQGEAGAVLGIEIQPELAEMARRSVMLNRLEAKIRIETADLRQLPENIQRNSFDYVISNPPFFPVTQGVVSENRALALAKFEIECTLDDVVCAASRLVRGNGRVVLVYPADRLVALLTVLEKYHLTPRRLALVHSRPDSSAHLCLVEARPGAPPGLEVHPPVFIYNQDGDYTDLMNQIFHGKKI